MPHTKFSVNLETWWRGVPKFDDRIRNAAAFGMLALQMRRYQGKTSMPLPGWPINPRAGQ